VLIKPLSVTRNNTAAKGPDALDWQNLFGSTKNLDKICLRQIFDLSNVGALRYSRIFVNHKCQSHRNKHHRFARCSWERLHEISRVMGSLYVTVIFTASIECVASAHYLACEYSRLSYAPLLCFARMRVGCIRRLHNYCLCSRFFSFLNSFNSSRSSCYFYYASGGFTFIDCKVLVLEIIISAGFGLKYSD